MDDDAGADSDAVDAAAMVGYTAVILFEWMGCINLAALTMDQMTGNDALENTHSIICNEKESCAMFTCRLYCAMMCEVSCCSGNDTSRVSGRRMKD